MVRRPDRHQKRRTRREFLKFAVGSTFAVPVVGLLALPGDASAGPGWFSPKLSRPPRRRSTPTPVPPTPTPTPTPPPLGPPPPPAPLPGVSVKDFGAVGDGIADDTAAIQRAIDTLQGSPDAILSFPDGTYLLTRSVTVTRPLQLTGAGAEQVAIRAAGGFHMLQFSDVDGVSVRGLTIQGVYPNESIGFGIWTYGVSNLTIDGCRFISIPDTAVSLSNVSNVRVTNCQFDVTGQSGIRLQDPDAGNRNQYVHLEGNTFTNVNLTARRGHAAIQTQGGSAIHEHLTIHKNYVQSQGVGLGLDAVDFATVTDNRIVGNGEEGEGIAFTGSNNRIAGNQINNCGAAGILVWGVAYRGIASNVIEGNTCWDNAQGIAIVCGERGTVIDGLVIRGNRCYSQAPDHPQNYGIQSYVYNGITDYTWRNVSITDNDLRGNAVGPMSIVPPARPIARNNLG